MCNVLNSNAVLLAHHFQHRVEILFKEILVIGSRSFGKVKYYAIRLGIQGVCKIYSFLWILNALTFSEESLDDYADLLDSVVCGNLQSEAEPSHLYYLVKTF